MRISWLQLAAHLCLIGSVGVFARLVVYPVAKLRYIMPPQLFSLHTLLLLLLINGSFLRGKQPATRVRFFGESTSPQCFFVLHYFSSWVHFFGESSQQHGFISSGKALLHSVSSLD